MTASFMYVVRFWVAPEGEKALFAWLDGGHHADVLAQPGFLSVKRLKLDQPGEDGWNCYMMLYSLESRKALEDYFANTQLAERFMRERAGFERHLRMDRAWGEVVMSMSN